MELQLNAVCTPSSVTRPKDQSQVILGPPESLSHPSGFPALLVLLLLVVNSSVYGPWVISFSKSQENATGFQNVSM